MKLAERNEAGSEIAAVRLKIATSSLNDARRHLLAVGMDEEAAEIKRIARKVRQIRRGLEAGVRR